MTGVGMVAREISRAAINDPKSCMKIKSAAKTISYRLVVLQETIPTTTWAAFQLAIHSTLSTNLPDNPKLHDSGKNSSFEGGTIITSHAALLGKHQFRDADGTCYDVWNGPGPVPDWYACGKCCLKKHDAMTCPNSANLQVPEMVRKA